MPTARFDRLHHLNDGKSDATGSFALSFLAIAEVAVVCMFLPCILMCVVRPSVPEWDHWHDGKPIPSHPILNPGF